MSSIRLLPIRRFFKCYSSNKGAVSTSTTDYSHGFDVNAYLGHRFSLPEQTLTMHEFTMQKLHEHFQSVQAAKPGTEFKVLDYGCGPVISNVISAARVASEIVLAEYTEEGRTAVRMWLEKNPNSFNWSPFHKYVVQTLEGGSVQAAEEREKRLRSIVKAVVECDATQDPPIVDGYQGPYDAVIACLCLTTATKTIDEFVKAVHKVSALIKPGGCMLFTMLEPVNKTSEYLYYPIGDKTYAQLAIDCSFAESTFRKVFQEVSVKKLPADAAIASRGVKSILFFTVRK